MENGNGPILGAMIVPVYTFFIAIELWRERRRTRYSRAAAIVVPCLHAGIFLVPLAMRAFLPEGYNAAWLTVFTLETILYAVGTAFIVMLMVKDHHVHVYRTAACTDHLTGLLNRRTFLDNALALCAQQAKRSEPVAMLMFDLDHFKSINDRFGHAAGDEVLRVFGRVVRASTRMDDIIGRFGGEEFIAIVPGGLESANKIAERVRASFEAAGVTVADHAIGATVSIGAAISYDPVKSIDALIARADAALYRAKHDGRNRLHIAEEEMAAERARLIAAARRAAYPAHARFCADFAAQHGRLIDGPPARPIATSHLPYSLYHAGMWRSPSPARTGADTLEAYAERAGAALACAYSNSAEFDAALIAERRAAGVYGPRRHRKQMLATAAGIAAGLAMVVFLIV